MGKEAAAGKDADGCRGSQQSPLFRTAACHQPSAKRGNLVFKHGSSATQGMSETKLHASWTCLFLP